ncbi:hypothetical protein BGX34_002013 [Mortierella sp. NVP85]|nr:hypothetical protein BGX34_002013 [Mortierella sp. NVP85]
MFLPSQEELTLRQQQYHEDQGEFYQRRTMNESDEDGLADGRSLSSSAMDYGESDLKDTDSDTRSLIAHLTDLDSGLPILLERVKQNLHSGKEMISFFKKRAVMEAEYGTNILKLATGFRDTYRQQSEGSNGQAHFKQGTYGDCWLHVLEIHERLGNNRLEFSRDLQVLSEELSSIYKETDRSRKQFKEAGAKQERIVQEHEQNLEKTKQKYDTLTEEWERAILQKAADPAAAKKTMTKGMNIFRGPKSVSQLQRQEEEAKAKASAAHEQYKLQLARTNDVRQYYFSHTLPSILKNLKDTIDESDLSLQYYMMRYGYMYEDYMMKDAVVMNPINSSGMKHTFGASKLLCEYFEQSNSPLRFGIDLGLRDRVDMINKDSDLQSFIQAYSTKANPVTKDAAPYQEYLMSAQAQAIINPKPTFGCDLAEQLIRDEADLPEIVVKCTEAIERFGMDVRGIYRVSGITSATNKLRSAFDRDCASVDLSTEENCGDINSVASVLKSWFRDLPEPLLTRKLYPEFIRAVSIEDPAVQLMTLHEVTNQLPDPNYATLKFLMCHLHRVQENRAVNMMGPSNLGLIFGPTLTSTSGSGGDAVNDLADMGMQCKVVETLLSNYVAIFDFDEDEEEGMEQQGTEAGHDYHHGYHGAMGDHDQQQYDEFGLPMQRLGSFPEGYIGGDRMVPVAEEAEEGQGEDGVVPFGHGYGGTLKEYEHGESYGRQSSQS